MTLEATLERIAVALETIAKQGGTVAQAVAELGKPDAAPAPAPAAKGGKKNEGVKDAAANAAAAAAAAAAASAPAPAPAPATEGPTWPDVLAKIQEVNKSTTAGLGRDGVVKVMQKFGLDPAKGDTVPKLKDLNKNAEILAFVNGLLNPQAAAAPAPAADIDLGL